MVPTVIVIEHGNIPQQVVDQRRNKFEAAEAAYVAANAQRDQADAAIKAAEADVERRATAYQSTQERARVFYSHSACMHGPVTRSGSGSVVG